MGGVGGNDGVRRWGVHQLLHYPTMLSGSPGTEPTTTALHNTYMS